MGVVDLSELKVKQGTFEVPIATYEQVVQAGDDFYIITARDSTLIKEINDIDKRLHVKYNFRFDFFVLFAKEQTRQGETEYLVKTFTKLDNRIVERVREISHPSYDFVKEGDDLEKQRDDEKLYKIRQTIGNTAEQLAHALRKDLGVKTHAFFDADRTTKSLVSDSKEFMGGIKNNAKNS
jgi:hypothetical protein